MTDANHTTQQQRLEFNFEQETLSETWQGSWDNLWNKLDGIAGGDASAGNGRVYTGGVLTRREGGRAVLELAMKACYGKAWWGFSFVEVSKPIKTWLATKISDTSSLQTELNKIDLWEQQKSNGGQGVENYLAFRYDNTNALTGYTLDLAKKMQRGVESYSIYMPVITCRRTSTAIFTDGITAIGKYMSAPSVDAETMAINAGQLSQFTSLKSYWLKTGDEISCSSDGTLSRVETWQGLDDIDKDLYQQA